MEGAWLVMAMAWAAEPCETPTARVETAEKATIELDLERAHTALDDARDAWSCGAEAEPESVARWWLARGVVAQFKQEDGFPFFRQAAGIAPDVWWSPYGPMLEASYKQAQARKLDIGMLQIGPVPRGGTVLVDGWDAEPDLVATEGLRLVQVRKGRSILFSQWVDLAAGGRERVDTGLTRKARKKAPLYAAVTMGGLAAISSGFAAREANLIRVGSEAERDAARLRNIGFSTGFVVLATGAVTASILHFTL